MRIAALVLLCFLVTWGMKYMDERLTFGQFIAEMFSDVGGFLFGMAMSFVILIFVYGILRFTLEPFFQQWNSN
jgi:hypothetical protein